jgi:hypothetical protein
LKRGNLAVSLRTRLSPQFLRERGPVICCFYDLLFFGFHGCSVNLV